MTVFRVSGAVLLGAIVTLWVSSVSHVFGAETLHGSLDISCGICHGDAGETVPYPGSTLDHSIASFKLTGQHRTVSCRECHKDLIFRGTDSDCGTCHDDIHNGELGNDCARCHTTQSFTVSYDVNGFHETTRFPLRGAHLTVPCIECHTSADEGIWRGLSADCVSCHIDEYDLTTDPDHRNAGISYDCAMCHDEQPGFRLVYDHSQSGFDLTGAHIILECTECHEGSFFSTLPTECADCHRDDYNLTTEPDHSEAGYSLNCEDCHTTSVWVPATIGRLHESYPLTGAHETVDCALCHTDGEYFGTPQDCAACHDDDYSQAADPDHQELQLSYLCENCHTTIAWSPSTFSHDTTSYPLTGAHLTVDCVLCHADGAYYGTSPDCAACHSGDYDLTTEPNHSEVGFSLVCEDCHSTAVWIPSTFSHDTTSYPLTGAHLTVDCALCHIDGVYSGTPQDCAACHDDDYAVTTDPNHQVLQLSHLCEDCHTTTVWSPSTFSHDKTAFPLTGAHIINDCSVCHTASYGLHPPVACVSCHEEEYENAADHVSQSFPTDCSECHRTSAWEPSSFTHDEFPVYSGSHRDRWNTCADCHPAAGNFQVFTCFTCHSPNIHRTTYTSADCYECHPNGRE